MLVHVYVHSCYELLPILNMIVVFVAVVTVSNNLQPLEDQVQSYSIVDDLLH